MKIYQLTDQTGTFYGVTTAINESDALNNFHEAWQQPCYQFDEWTYRTNELSDTSFCLDPIFLNWDEDLTVIEYLGEIKYVD